MKQERMNNGYIFRYAAILVIIVAALLSLAAVVLAPYQQRNKDNEKRKNILRAAGIADLTDSNVQQLFTKHCTRMLLIDAQGNTIDETGLAFTTDMKTELYNKGQGLPYHLPLFIVEHDGHSISVVPLQGNGLWGAIWGYIAIADDGNTITGATFDHASETPGLGGEIATDEFQRQFAGKHIMKDNAFVSVTVQKGGITSLPETDRQYAVDAISGGSITSKGVDDMIRNVLNCYLPYFKQQYKKE